MGTALLGGDIEDLNGRACVVCPAHRYRIDITTGQKVDTDLCGKVCASSDQKQRVYKVACDDEFIWVELPEAGSVQRPVPSDYYNQPRLGGIDTGDREGHKGNQHDGVGLIRRNYGLLGAAPQTAVHRSGMAVSEDNSPFSDGPEPLQPYAGMRKGWTPDVSGFVAESPSKRFAADEPPLVLSQESVDDRTMEELEEETRSKPQVDPHSTNFVGRINFPAVKHDLPHVARRKAATAAILARSYKPPIHSAPTKHVASDMGRAVHEVNAASKNTPTTSQASQGGVVRQRTLFEAWGVQQEGSSASSIGPAEVEAMDT